MAKEKPEGLRRVDWTKVVLMAFAPLSPFRSRNIGSAECTGIASGQHALAGEASAFFILYGPTTHSLPPQIHLRRGNKTVPAVFYAFAADEIAAAFREVR